MQVTGGVMSFADGLRGILRQDPDTILVGEIRDEETARIAMQAALTGHFVLSSLHAVDSTAAIHRFTDMGIEPFLVASALSAVVGQRLLRRICTSCAEPYTPNAAESRMLRALLAPHSRVDQGQGLRAVLGHRVPRPGGRVRAPGAHRFDPRPDRRHVPPTTRSRRWRWRRACAPCSRRPSTWSPKGLTTVEDVLRSVYASGMDYETAQPGELAGHSSSPNWDPTGRSRTTGAFARHRPGPRPTDPAPRAFRRGEGDQWH